MAKNLVIVESPSKAKTIKSILGSNYDVIASVGHVIDLPKTKIGIDIENDFKPEYRVIKDRKTILEELKAKGSKANKVFLASDPDREGEAIAWHISNYINLGEKVKRIEFNEITKSAISNAVRNPRDINTDLVNSQQARRILDRIVGYKISPLIWPIVGRSASAGRVQSVALKLICDLENEILNFKPEKYYQIDILIKEKIKLSLSEISGEKVDKIKNRVIFDKACSDLKNAEVKIKELDISNKTQSPPAIYKTSTLQQAASSNLGYNATKTMRLAQKLYEGTNIDGETKGLITYMRTDSTRVSDEAKQSAKEFIIKNYGKEYVGTYRKYSKSKNSQDAHEGIRPTYIDLTPEYMKTRLTNEEYKLYKLIWERFVISQLANVKYEQLKIVAEHKNYTFKGTINKIIFDGYYKLYKSEDMIQTLDFPDLKLNTKYKIDELIPTESETKAPSRFNEASLIKKLESLGIGRPSTYASIIEAIKSKNYVDVIDKRLVPTAFGKEVKNELEDNFKDIMNVKFTAMMENNLDEVASGKLNWVDLLRDFYKVLEKEMIVYKEKVNEFKNTNIYTDVKCTYQDGRMLLKSGNFGKYLVCEFDSKDKISIKGIDIDQNDIKDNFVKIKDKVEQLLNSKKGKITDVYTENNKMMYLKEGKYGAYLESEDYKNDNIRKPLSKEIKVKLKKNQIKIENGIILLKDILESIVEGDNKILSEVGVCEKCGKEFTIKSGRYGKFLACSGYPECKNIKKIPKEGK
jgi:DNA topoisomerase I